MADGIQLSTLAESLKECQDARTHQQANATAFQVQQQNQNTTFQHQLQDVINMLHTLLASQNRPRHELPPLVDPPPYPLPFILGLEMRTHAREGRVGDDDRHQDKDDRRDGWEFRDDRQLRDDEYPDANREDRLL
jgi:hypothetical protein